MRSLTIIAGESRLFCFDFSGKTEVLNGATLSSPSVPAVSGVTIGVPAVLAATFSSPYGDVPSGQGVSVSLTSSTVGTYVMTCQVTTSGGATLKAKGQLVVVSATG